MLPPSYPENSPGPDTLIQENFSIRDHLSGGRFDSFCNLETPNSMAQVPFALWWRKGRHLSQTRWHQARGKRGGTIWRMCLLSKRFLRLLHFAQRGQLFGSLCDYTGLGSSTLLRNTYCWNSLRADWLQPFWRNTISLDAGRSHSWEIGGCSSPVGMSYSNDWPFKADENFPGRKQGPLQGVRRQQ